MVKAKGPRNRKSYWLRAQPALPWVQPWEPDEPFQWSPELLQFKQMMDELLGHLRQDGNRLHLFRAMILCQAYNIQVPQWITESIVGIWEDLFCYADKRGAERIRDAIPEILLAQLDRNRIGHSVFHEEHQAKRERTIFHEVTKRRYDPSGVRLKMKQIYGEVGDLISMKADQVARIYRQLMRQLDRQFEPEEISVKLH